MTPRRISADTRPELVPALEAFRKLGIHRATGYAAIANGTLPIKPIRVGGQWKFRRAELDGLLEGNPPQQASPRSRAAPRRVASG